MITRDYCRHAFGILAMRGIEIRKGVSATQLAVCESAYGIVFPPDLRLLLSEGMPYGRGFFDWSYATKYANTSVFLEPWDGIAFDIENGDYWCGAWGDRPAHLDDRLRIARGLYERAPRLIPVYMHRYLPGAPCESGNAVISVHQTDIIHYGNDLASYLFEEFGVPDPFPVPGSPRRIDFWSDLIESG